MSEDPGGWKTATIVAVAAGLVLSATVYLLMSQRNDDLADRIAAIEAAATTTSPTSSTTPPASTTTSAPPDLPGLPDLSEFGDLEGDIDELLDLFMGTEGMGDVLEGILEDAGLEGFGGLDGLGGDLSQLGPGLDPGLTQCFSIDTMGEGAGVPGGDVDDQVVAIAGLVAADRGISSETPLEIELTTREDVASRARAINDAAVSDEDAAAQSRLYAALGVIEPGTDIETLVLDALDAAVAGYYDTDTNELVIGSEEIDALGALIVAHEIQHAVAAEVLGLPDTENIDDRAGSDAATAALSVAEGDASLVSQRFMLDHLSFGQILEVTMESLSTQQSLTGVPHLISRQLQFPYLEGLAFTCGLFVDGGWEAVDQSYHDLPTTSAQILFPDRYRAGEEAVDLPDPAAPPGWTEIDTDTLGAATLLFLLEAPGDDSAAALTDPLLRAEAWAGGKSTIWSRGDDTALALVLADRGEAIPLCDTMQDFASAAYEGAVSDRDGRRRVDAPEQIVVVDCSDDLVRLLVAPDDATISALLG